MRILHVTTGVNTQSAVFRLHEALRRSGVDSFIYSGINSLDSQGVIFPRYASFIIKIFARMERFLLKLYPHRSSLPWNGGFTGFFLRSLVDKINPDVIHMHWINQTISIPDVFRLRRPTVWTLHDSWAFTGGCHIPSDCYKYEDKCGKCPQLKSGNQLDLSRVIYLYKHYWWRGCDINIIAPSEWMKRCVVRSSLLSAANVKTIPNCIDESLFFPRGKTVSRRRLGASMDEKIILFGANNAVSDINKGFNLLMAARDDLIARGFKFKIYIFGSDKAAVTATENLNGVVFLGKVSDKYDLPYIYSAADVLVIPSVSENLPNVALESLSCGVRVVAFDVGGNSDIIYTKELGRLVTPYNTLRLADALVDVMSECVASDVVCAAFKARFTEDLTCSLHKLFYTELAGK